MTTREKTVAIVVLIVAACGVGPLIGILGEQIVRFLYTATDHNPYVRRWSWLIWVLTVGLLLTAWQPVRGGLTLNDTFKEWKAASAGFLILLILVVPAWLYFLVGQSTPPPNASWTIVTIAAISEELIFRGGLFAGLLTIFGRLVPEKRAVFLTIVATSLAFSFWHMPWPGDIEPFTWFQMGYTGVGGLVYGWIRARTGSIWVPVAAHAAVNFLAVIY